MQSTRPQQDAVEDQAKFDSQRRKEGGHLIIAVLLVGLVLSVLGAASVWRSRGALAQEPSPGQPRGCPACHVLLPPGALPPELPPGGVTLPWEAHMGSMARNGGVDLHPNEAPDGTSLEPDPAFVPIPGSIELH